MLFDAHLLGTHVVVVAADEEAVDNKSCGWFDGGGAGNYAKKRYCRCCLPLPPCSRVRPSWWCRSTQIHKNRGRSGSTDEYGINRLFQEEEGRSSFSSHFSSV